MRNQFFNVYRCFFIVCISLYLFSNSIFAQKKYTHNIHILSQNDSYLLTGKDGYFTNDLTIGYSWTSKNTENTSIHTIDIGQWMYNAKNGSYKELYKIDRPVTAYLFAQYAHTSFAKENVLYWKTAVGTIGPNAQGRPVQEFIHRTLGMYKPEEWQYQLRNALAVNTTISYAPMLFTEHTTTNIYPIVSADIGMTFTNIKAGTYLTIGRKNTNSKSSLWNAQLNRTKEDTNESFFYFKPILAYNIYNATVQGNLFKNDIHAGQLNRWQFQPSIGWKYAADRFNMDLGIHYTSREAIEQRYTQWYGNILLGWNF